MKNIDRVTRAKFPDVVSTDSALDNKPCKRTLGIDGKTNAVGTNYSAML